ncbi:MAG: hypothetical protein IKO78_05420 [Bacilli bacterium]|nr:hypothetical protein [Bacilli bacterium]
MKAKNVKVNESKIVSELKTCGKLVLNHGVHAVAAIGAVNYTVRHLNIATIILTPIVLVALGVSCYRFGTKIARQSRKDGTFISRFLTAPTLMSAIKNTVPTDAKKKQKTIRSAS